MVDLSNLQRQIAHTTDRIGMAKVVSAAGRRTAINPDLRVEAHATRLSADNALDLIGRYDIVCDGTDNFATRFLVADACVLAKRTLVSAAVLRFEGQLSVFKPHDGGPCYRCLYPEPPPPGMVPTCSEAGVLGAVTGVMGTLQATEVLKEILGIGDTLSGRLLVWDALATRFRTIKLRPDPSCALCGPGGDDQGSERTRRFRKDLPVPSDAGIGRAAAVGIARPGALRVRRRVRRGGAGPAGCAVRHQPRLRGTLPGLVGTVRCRPGCAHSGPRRRWPGHAAGTPVWRWTSG